MNTPTRTAPRAPRPTLDRAVDVGFAVLLIVCAMRYFAFHTLAGTGVAVLALAIGTGLSYAAAVVSVERVALVGGSLAGQRVGLLLATALWLPLTVIAPSFGWCAFALIFAVHRVLPPRFALAVSGVIVVAVSLGLWLMSRGQDLGLVLGPFFGGLVLSYAYATITRTLAAKHAVIAELTETRAQLARSEREAGALAERNRVASELHDTVAQRTASALLLLESAQQLGPDAALSPAIAEASDALRDTLTETRRLVHGLADPRAVGATISSALAAEAAAAGAEFARSGEEVSVPETTVHALQRITREALVNAAKHAGPATTRVTVTYFPHAVGVDIADDGVGFDPAAAPAGGSGAGAAPGAGTGAGSGSGPRPEEGGFGLRAMTWRAQNLGGTLSIESRPGGGTVIAANIPLTDDASDSASTGTLPAESETPT